MNDEAWEIERIRAQDSLERAEALRICEQRNRELPIWGLLFSIFCVGSFAGCVAYAKFVNAGSDVEAIKAGLEQKIDAQSGKCYWSKPLDKEKQE